MTKFGVPWGDIRFAGISFMKGFLNFSNFVITLDNIGGLGICFKVVPSWAIWQCYFIRILQLKNYLKNKKKNVVAGAFFIHLAHLSIMFSEIFYFDLDLSVSTFLPGIKCSEEV